MESRVGTLALTVRAPAGRVDALAPVAEEFTARILGRCDELLEAQAPGRVVLVRQLDLSLRLVDRALDHDGEIEAFAEELTDDVARRVAAAGEFAAGDPDVAAFDDEVAWRAAHMEARAGGHSDGAWRFEALEADGEPLRTLTDGPTPRALDLLVRLHRRGTLRSSLEALPAAVVEGLAGRLEAGEGAPDVPPSEEVIAACIAGLSSGMPRSLVRVCVAVAARDVLGPSASDGEIAVTARAALGRLDGGDDQAPASGGIESDVSSAFGGLFYLLNPALELSIAESLWGACLPEGLVLAQAAATLLGAAAAEDSAASLFGGADPDDRLPAIADEQQSEISFALLAALRDALPRRGLADLPAVVLRLVESQRGRLLAVAASGKPVRALRISRAFAGRDPTGPRRVPRRLARLRAASARHTRAGRARSPRACAACKGDVARGRCPRRRGRHAASVRAAHADRRLPGPSLRRPRRRRGSGSISVVSSACSPGWRGDGDSDSRRAPLARRAPRRARRQPGLGAMAPPSGDVRLRGRRADVRTRRARGLASWDGRR